jgi:hypothetical protein
MRNVAVATLLGLALSAGPALAEPSAEAPKPKCETAEINPVTGHVFCIKPLGAPVEPPPSNAKPACKPEQSRGQWAWAPNCTPDPEGM